MTPEHALTTLIAITTDEGLCADWRQIATEIDSTSAATRFDVLHARLVDQAPQCCDADRATWIDCLAALRSHFRAYPTGPLSHAYVDVGQPKL